MPFCFWLFAFRKRVPKRGSRGPVPGRRVPSVGGQNLRNRVDSFSSVRPHSVSLYWSGTRPSVRCPRAGPEQNASCRSAAAFSANPMSNRQRAEEQQVHKCSIVRRRLLADDGLDGLVTPVASPMHRLCCVVFARQHITSDDPANTRERLFHHAHMTLTVCARGVLSGHGAAVFNSSSVCA